ncbi:ParB N-terminal domain-containing protein [Sneathiella sp.]|uniref:ParB N-terminal domain-containing protein n=1 Tax=Sneathiella sp. TaxID=1964365 RepID=UPI0035680AFB
MTSKPLFFKEKPEPIIKQRLYNGRKLVVWDGKVKISAIQGWVENPRIELAKKKLISKIGDRELSQDEIFDLMKNDAEVKLKELRDDIIKNGLREPLTLSHDGKLLDGNRRFFALQYALETMQESDPNRQDLEAVEAFVLTEDATEEDEQNVLVEENFSASLKIEWPDYVKAIKVVEAHEDGLTTQEISKKFSWAKSKIRETLRIHEIISEFLMFATTPEDPDDESGGGLGLVEQDAETIAAKRYQFFNEAQKSFFEPLKTDFEFKIQFFKWVYEGKFSSFPEVRVAYKAWNLPEAKAALSQLDPSAAKSAKAIIDYNSRVVKSTDEAVGRIDNFTKFLKELTAEEIKIIPKTSSDNLEEALDMVIKMTKATN